MLFLSQILGKPVQDRHGEPFGKVRDLIVALGEKYPPVTGLVVRVASGRDIFLHKSALKRSKLDSVQPGQRVRMSVLDTAKGREVRVLVVV